MCHFLVSGYLKPSDESQMGMVSTLFDREKEKLFASRRQTQWQAKETRDFSLKHIYGSCLSQKKR